MKSALEYMVVEACVGLFSTLEVPFRLATQETHTERDSTPMPPLPELTAAVLAFSGPTMRGTLVLAATFDFLASCRPREARSRTLSSASAGDWLYVRDWSKELVNQLLGRIKRQIVARGLTFEIGALTAQTGDAAGGLVRRQSVEPTRFVSGAAPVTVWFDVEISAGAAATLATKRADGLPKEGDIVLF